MSAKGLAWFTTSAGRTFMKYVACGTSMAVFGAQFFPQTMFIDNYRDFVGLRRNGKPFPVTAELQKIFDQVVDDLKISEFTKRVLEPFMVYGYDVWHVGALNYSNGAKIGLPIHYIHKKPGEIDKSGIIINDEFVNWNRKEAQSLLEALILSENAKKYSIAREICMVDNSSALIQPVISAGLVLLYYTLTSIVNERMELYDKPRRLRFMMYGLLGVIMWGFWATQKDVMTKYYEYGADEKVSNLGINYVKGGLEFYNKVIQRNIALRALGGANGEKTFTKGGNEAMLFREKHIPITSRKQFFERALKEYEEGSVTDIEAEPAIA